MSRPCANLALAPAAKSLIKLHVDACALQGKFPFGGTITDFNDLTGRQIKGRANMCGNGEMRGRPGIFFTDDMDGLTADDTSGTMAFGTEPFAVIAVALYKVARANTFIFAKQLTAVPNEGIALIANYAFAAPGWDGTSSPTLAPATSFIGAQTRIGLEAQGDPKSASVTGPLTAQDCKSHIFRVMRDGAEVTFFVDGIAKGKTVIGPTTPLTGGPRATIGRSETGAPGTFFEGLLGELIVMRGPTTPALVEGVEKELRIRWETP